MKVTIKVKEFDKFPRKVDELVHIDKWMGGEVIPPNSNDCTIGYIKI
jgi:hypothetical protein